jgi:hypothetical protein
MKNKDFDILEREGGVFDRLKRKPKRGWDSNKLDKGWNFDKVY